MEYRRLGSSGLLVSALSFGSWLTFGKSLDLDSARKCMHKSYDQGINFFDNAEVYANGISEMIMGEVVKDFRRDNLVISTKLFWGGELPNQRGLSRKHLMEGINASLKRLQLDYVDLLFCHRPDPDTPLEETILAMDTIVRSGKALYWGTSEWPAEILEEAMRLSKDLNAISPTMEQPEYNLFNRRRVELEYQPLYVKGLGTTIWSPLASGTLTGKYQNSIGEGTRLSENAWLQNNFTAERKAQVDQLKLIADSLGVPLTQLAIAWCLKNNNVSTVILGARNIEQIDENIKSLNATSLLTEDVMNKIDNIFPV